MRQRIEGVRFEEWVSEMMADTEFVDQVGLQQPGFLIARARNNRGLTQQALAELAQVSPKTLARIESGCHIPSWKLFCRLASALQVKINLDLQTS